MRILSEWVTETPLIIHTRGQSLFTFEFFADDVVELAAERFVANGMRYHTPYDALNDIRNLEIPVRKARALGLHTVPGLVYTHSPVHTDVYYADKAKQLVALGVDGVFIKDPSGLLTPERIVTLAPAIKTVIGDLPLQLHTHCLSGLGPYVALQAVSHGVETVHTATSTLANAASHPPSELFARNCRRRGFDVSVDLEIVEEAAARLEIIARGADKPTGTPMEYDEFHFHHQVAGGMISNLEYQLSTLGIGDKLEAVLEEAGQVRADLGYPIVVSPFAQYIMTQAVMNVMGKERYASVPNEVRRYVLGGYGEVAGEINPNLFDKIAQGKEPITERPGALVPPALDKLRAERGPFASDDDLLLAAFYAPKEYEALKAVGSIDTTSPLEGGPLRTLVRELVRRPNIRAVQIASG
jgi:oxaloacetate decarboxylase alpha subunit